jgi:hypothetical protein
MHSLPPPHCATSDNSVQCVASILGHTKGRYTRRGWLGICPHRCRLEQAADSPRAAWLGVNLVSWAPRLIWVKIGCYNNIDCSIFRGEKGPVNLCIIGGWLCKGSLTTVFKWELFSIALRSVASIDSSSRYSLSCCFGCLASSKNIMVRVGPVVSLKLPSISVFIWTRIAA